VTLSAMTGQRQSSTTLYSTSRCSAAQNYTVPVQYFQVLDCLKSTRGENFLTVNVNTFSCSLSFGIVLFCAVYSLLHMLACGPCPRRRSSHLPARKWDGQEDARYCKLDEAAVHNKSPLSSFVLYISVLIS